MHTERRVTTRAGSSISLIMATLGRQAEVERMIASLIEQSDRRFELIVVDQNPDDRLIPCLEHAIAEGLNVRHERLSQCGLSKARNHGLAFADSSIVAFPDDDCWYEPNTVAIVLERFAQNDIDGLLAFWVERGEVEHENSSLKLTACRTFRGISGSSITLFLNRACLRAVKGFDENLGVGAWFGAGEETDLVMRVLETGANIVHYPAVRVHHPHGTKTDVDLKRQCMLARRRGRGTGALYAKHGITPGVVLRGCLGPLVRPIRNGLGWRAAVSGGATVLGRIEGLLAWHRRRAG